MDFPPPDAERGRDAATSPLARHYGRLEPLSGDDDAIRNAVDQAELPPLLAALSVIMEDTSLIPDDLMPPTPPLLAAAAPHGGMSEAAQQKARALATEALIKLRDRGTPDITLNAEFMKAALKFITKNGSDDNLDLLLTEFGHPIDLREPHWTKSEVAPKRDFKVIVIGGGLSGIAAAYRLSQSDIPFVVFEKGAEVGGVWWNNSYPGCRLDTPNYAYSFSFAPKADWPQLFSQRGEIFAYLKGVVDQADLRKHFRLSSEVLAMRFDEASGLWSVTVSHEGNVAEYRANAIIAACGNLNRPRIPEIEGQDSFKGEAFHSSQWRHDVDVTGKRVAVVGTGASAFQIVPSIAETVEKLTVFQRSPPWMLPTPSYHKDMAPGMLWLLARMPTYGRWYRLWQFWLSSMGRLPAVTVDPRLETPGIHQRSQRTAAPGKPCRLVGARRRPARSGREIDAQLSAGHQKDDARQRFVCEGLASFERFTGDGRNRASHRKRYPHEFGRSPRCRRHRVRNGIQGSGNPGTDRNHWPQ